MKPARSLPALAATSVLLGACQAQPPAATPLPHQVIHTSASCGTEESSVRRISDVGRLKEILADTPAPASADFTRSLVLRVSMGQQPSAGSQFGVTGVRAEAQRLIIDTLWSPPDPGRMHAMMVTRPCVILSVAAPATAYRSVQVLDQNGRERASATLAAR